MRVSVVVPCYRSQQTLPQLVASLSPVLATATDGYEILLVVDGSPDDTWSVAADLAAADDHVRAVQLMRNYGQHNALLAGIARARHEVVVTMDDDLQHPPDQVPLLLAELADPRVDLVYGVPDAEEHGALRSFASRTTKAALAVTGVPNARDVSAFRAFRTDLRRGFNEVADPHASVDVLLSWTTTGTVRCVVHMDHRAAGRSTYTPSRLLRHAITMITGYSTVPLRLVTYLGLVCGALGLVLLAIVLYGFFSHRTTVAGFTTLASMVALFSSAQMLSLGILGTYVGRLHVRSLGGPTYLVRSEVSRTQVPADR